MRNWKRAKETKLDAKFGVKGRKKIERANFVAKNLSADLRWQNLVVGKIGSTNDWIVNLKESCNSLRNAKICGHGLVSWLGTAKIQRIFSWAEISGVDNPVHVSLWL